MRVQYYPVITYWAAYNIVIIILSVFSNLNVSVGQYTFKTINICYVCVFNTCVYIYNKLLNIPITVVLNREGI